MNESQSAQWLAERLGLSKSAAGAVDAVRGLELVGMRNPALPTPRLRRTLTRIHRASVFRPLGATRGCAVI